MADLKICRICLQTEIKMFEYNRSQLKSYYEEVLAVMINDNDGLPCYFCCECAAMLIKFHKFKEKCLIGQDILKVLRWSGPITYEAVQKIDRKRKKLRSNLSICTNTHSINCYVINDKEIEDIKLENGNYKHSDNEGNHNDNIIHKLMEEDRTLQISSKNVANICKKHNVEETTNKQKSDREIKRKLLDKEYWKIYHCNEEEATKQFLLRAEDKKYLSANYKCTDCLKGFSKESMLKCHILIQHSESRGALVCNFCKTRTKWPSQMIRHIRQHYIKYECLRCNRICPLETTAIRHEEYHSGIGRECVQCGKKFRHSSTYYTHMRTHRSDFVCTICGASFVSEAGLRQHKRIKHVHDEMDSPDDDEEVNTSCEKCDIRFETRKAYEEHLFHSAMHSEVLEKVNSPDDVNEKGILIAPKKVLGKKMQAKVTEGLKSRKSTEQILTPIETKRRRRQKRNYCKPSTCYQCGEHFATQIACMKHHQAEHPRTSFFPPTARHICEICGASLAPGSIATHQNMHTKTKMHPCQICGRQFYATVSLKRHLVTHTGEKPFACTLCDKRFTQNNSMKLHYRTIHLKQPYPKRKKRLKWTPQGSSKDDSDETKGIEDIIDGPSKISNNFSDQDIRTPTDVIVDQNVHYLTLN